MQANNQTSTMSFSELSERTLNSQVFVNDRTFPGENNQQEN